MRKDGVVMARFVKEYACYRIRDFQEIAQFTGFESVREECGENIDRIRRIYRSYELGLCSEQEAMRSICDTGR